MTTTLDPISIRCVSLHAQNKTPEALELRNQSLREELGWEDAREFQHPDFWEHCKTSCVVIATFVAYIASLYGVIEFVKWLGWA